VHAETSLCAAGGPMAALRAHFAPVDHVYLNTAGTGLPPRAAVDALRTAIENWQSGTTDDTALDECVVRSRHAFAKIVDIDAADVAICSHVSSISGVVAASLPRGAHVLAADEDFTSVLFPFLVMQGRGDLTVTTVPLDLLLDELGPEHTIVAVSATQSADGRVLGLDALAAAAAHHGVATYVDVTQAAGWRSIQAGRFDVTACGAYKWLCCPRGAAFVTVRPSARAWLTPINAGWYAGADPTDSVYGPPLRLASDARAYQVAPAWSVWPAAAQALELLATVDPLAIQAHNVALVNSLRTRLALEASNSAIVSLPVPDAGPQLESARIIAARRRGALRLSFHLYNDEGDVERAAVALRGRLA
jgi:selenocysteine lyase/cysteine desulfurase